MEDENADSCRILTAFTLRPKLKSRLFDISIAWKSATNEQCLSQDDNLNASENEFQCVETNSNTNKDIETERDIFESKSEIASHQIKSVDSLSQIASAKNCILAIVNGENKIWFFNLQGKMIEKFELNEELLANIYGVKFVQSLNELKLLCLVYTSSQKWFIYIYNVVNEKIQSDSFVSSECPIQQTFRNANVENSKIQIATLNNAVFLLVSTNVCSAMWALPLSNMKWKTLVLEHTHNRTLRNPLIICARSPEPLRTTNYPVSVTIQSTALTPSSAKISFKTLQKTQSNAILLNNISSESATYSYFDVSELQLHSEFRNSKITKTRVLLCENGKGKLNVLQLLINGQIETRTVRTKRSKELSWIVQGPQLAAWDKEKNIVIYDSSGKLFYFSGIDYRIKKVIADLGKATITTLTVAKGWCFLADSTKSCIHAFFYL